MDTKFLPIKYINLWERCVPLLEKGRPGDLGHALEVARFICEYKGDLEIDLDVLIPVAMMHDIGHSAILPHHFECITGPNKIKNGKLVHMLAGAKIANDILLEINYDNGKIEKIVELISIHDFDQIENVDLDKIYNSTEKRFFHDVDSLDRYTAKRLEGIVMMYKDKKQLFDILDRMLSAFFYDEFKNIAKSKLIILRDDFIK